jgi:hypothetical protein
MPHELAVFLGIKLSQADAILIALDSAGLCNMRLLIYHTRSVERKLKTRKKGTEKSILTPIKQKMMSAVIVVSYHCQIAAQAPVTE